ncbi:hypothetical protein [Streptomyces sp. 11x1]|uniref:hypothetical protein n=1 Tax=Streptomyces sp. 11x1 TaxID=3038642 RepID=UPI00292CC6F8|nr:hypothetical protein [Streptomyces sp. 11x1]WNZ10158.1 hypothetical protein P8T65_22910 [Streptomyces sp. 11x1]
MLKRQYWGVTVLLITVVFSYVGYRLNDQHPSLPWMVGGLVTGVIVTTGLARIGRE